MRGVVGTWLGGDDRRQGSRRSVCAPAVGRVRVGLMMLQ
jgi:hypothetical protein